MSVQQYIPWSWPMRIRAINQWYPLYKLENNIKYASVIQLSIKWQVILVSNIQNDIPGLIGDCFRMVLHCVLTGSCMIQVLSESCHRHSFSSSFFFIIIHFHRQPVSSSALFTYCRYWYHILDKGELLIEDQWRYRTRVCDGYLRKITAVVRVLFCFSHIKLMLQITMIYWVMNM